MKLSDSKYFGPRDFPIGIPHPDFLQKLEDARTEAGVRFIINSGGRTRKKNDSLKKSVKNSAHLMNEQNIFRAADIRATKSRDRYRILKSLLRHFNRIGIYKYHVHVDDDPTKPPNVVWYGG